MITGKNYIGNAQIAKGTKTFQTFNPRLNKLNEHQFTEATELEINQAVELAEQAFWEYKNTSSAKKASFLETIAEEINRLGDTLIHCFMLESGLPESRAIAERERTLFQLRSFAELLKEGSWVEARIDTAIPGRRPTPKPDLRKMNTGIGPIAVFGASNFPLAYSTAGGDTASALAAGCPVIVKSHPMHAGTGELVAAAIVCAVKKTNMPNGIFSNLNSSGIEVGQILVQHPKVKGVGFTGSIRGGRAILDIVAERKEPIPVFAEMGSMNPVILLPNYVEKNLNQVVSMYAESITQGAGQFCTNPGLILGIESELLNEFEKKLATAIEHISPTCMLHPTIFENYIAGKSNVLDQVGVCSSQKQSEERIPNVGSHTSATVSGKIFLENQHLHQEVFGPFSLIVKCKNKEEMIQIIHQLEGQLTGTILGEPEELSENKVLIEAVKERVGRVIFNGVPTGVEGCPSMQHGGPYPASTDARFTAVGTDAIKRWVRPISFQSCPNELLPSELQNENPLKIMRTVNAMLTSEPI